MINQQIGKYQITAEIARTQLATIYRARTPGSFRDYAIKVLNVYLSSEPSFRQGVEQQAKLVSSLKHEWLVPWYEVGEVDNQPYLVMPLMAHSLRERLEKQGALSLEESVKILSHIAIVLDYIHERGLLHLDIKPSNVLFLEGVPRLSDLGIARMMAHTTRATYASTPSQMAPEQWRKRSLDARTDIYQLGVLLFEMLTGQLPFSAYSDSSFMQYHLYDAVPSACKIAPHLPAGCDALLAKAMAKEPAQRFWSAGELLAELIRLSEAAGATVEVLQEAQAQEQEEQEQEEQEQEQEEQEQEEQEEPLLDITIPEPFIASPKEESDLKGEQAQYRLMIQNANQVLKDDPINAFGLNMRATAYLALNSPKKAAQDATEALLSTPDNIIFLKIRAEANLMLERYNSALSDAQSILNYDPTSSFALYIEEQANREVNLPTTWEIFKHNSDVNLTEYDTVLKQTGQALSINPNDVEALYMRAYAYVEEIEYEKAMEDITKVLELDPDYVKILLIRADIYMGLHKYEQAIIDIDVYLKQYPDSRQALDLKEKVKQEFQVLINSGGCLLFFTLFAATAWFGMDIEASLWWFLSVLLPGLSFYLMSTHKFQSSRYMYAILIWILGFVFLCTLLLRGKGFLLG